MKDDEHTALKNSTRSNFFTTVKMNTLVVQLTPYLICQEHFVNRTRHREQCLRHADRTLSNNPIYLHVFNDVCVLSLYNANGNNRNGYKK